MHSTGAVLGQRWSRILRWNAALLAAALLSLGCTSRAQRGFDLYHEARYPTALETLRAAEADLTDASEEQRVRYALYRGLTHLATGDALAADLWLGRAKDAFDRDPRILGREDRGRLLSAWRSLGRYEGQGRVGPAWLAGRSAVRVSVSRDAERVADARAEAERRAQERANAAEEAERDEDQTD